ncbi:ribonuclease P protein subunit [Candidatus Woesearchaeota archaeon]|nr:ribonuclease P protein subunit [Candidatus Woesearchaeota archaeon]
MEKGKKLLRGELIGSRIKVVQPGNSCYLGISGIIIDETKNMLTVRTEEGDKRLIKKGNTFKVTKDNKTIMIKGEDIAKRPEDRTKEIR